MDCLGGGVRRACAAACSNIDRKICQQSSHSCGQISPPPEEMGFHPRIVSPGYVAESWRDGGRRFRLLDQRFKGQIVESFLHHLGLDFLTPHCTTQRHGVKANIVDVPRYTLTALRDQCESCGCKQLGAVVSGHLEPVIDVAKSLCSRQTLQACHNGNALTQLGQARTHQPVRQFRLTGKDDLEQFSVCCLKVGKQTHGLQHCV